MEENSDHSVRSLGWSPTVLVDVRLKDNLIFVNISLARAKTLAEAELILTDGPVARELEGWRLAVDEASSDGRCGRSPTVLVDARLKDKFVFVAISLARVKALAKAELMLTPGPVARELDTWWLAVDEPSSDGRCAPPTPTAPSPGVAPPQAAAGPCCPRGGGLAWSEATWDGGRSVFCCPAAV